MAADPDKEVDGMSLPSNFCQSIERGDGVWADPVWVGLHGGPIYEGEAVSDQHNVCLHMVVRS